MGFLPRQLCVTLIFIVLIQCSQSYFAFPRNGRSMSFYFPRMGRSGESTQFEDNDYCCAEGVRSVTTIGKGELEMCPRDQPCCSGMTEKTKLYKGTIITECVEDNSLEKMKAYLEDE
ncbi:hypothetical protein DPMN_122842 [Dreissena polymorpha]|uniref:Uncharacterized protein n=1 Tax=Dreissena polymorpha TaxID=45954 RepID=A0A9D4GT74_DREPO|nr:hypothetical protein DPMN_122842 [Dreissena polymorpha]